MYVRMNVCTHECMYIHAYVYIRYHSEAPLDLLKHFACYSLVLDVYHVEF